MAGDTAAAGTASAIGAFALNSRVETMALARVSLNATRKMKRIHVGATFAVTNCAKSRSI